MRAPTRTLTAPSAPPPGVGCRGADAPSRGARSRRRGALRGLLAGALLALLLPAAGSAGPAAGDWPLHNGNLASTRAAAGSGISAATVGRLEVAWRLPFTSPSGLEGIFASTPLVVGGRVYALDLNSRLYAADLRTGLLLWTRSSHARNSGPNGIGYAGGRVFGTTDTTAYAVDAETGRQLWARRLASRTEQFIEVAPVSADGRVYLSTVGFPPGGRGALYALDAVTGRIVWRFDTIKGPWARPQAGGGGAWYPASVDADGRVYVGTANPGPWGGTPALPNGAAYAGPALYTDSLLVLDGRTGKLLWHDQVTPHDVRDYDFQDSPILASVQRGGRSVSVVIGAGKAGRVIAWDRATHRRLWDVEVGVHRNDRGPLPRKAVEVCPGLLGGVETPMAYAAGRVFVPVVNLCTRESAVSNAPLGTLDVTKGTGELVALDAATGRRLWRRVLPQPVFGCATVAGDVVFTSTFDGRSWGFRTSDGKLVWQARARAGSNSCPAVAGDTLLVGAGTGHPAHPQPVRELTAYRLR